MEEFFKTIQILFEKTPKKFQGLFAIILLCLIGIGCYFYFFPKEKSVRFNAFKSTIKLLGKIQIELILDNEKRFNLR